MSTVKLLSEANEQELVISKIRLKDMENIEDAIC